VSADLLEIEVVYARPEQQVLIQVSVPDGSSVRDAIVRSNILSDEPELDLETLAVGIFARRVTLDYILKTGDRVEIYRDVSRRCPALACKTQNASVGLSLTQRPQFAPGALEKTRLSGFCLRLNTTFT